MEYRPRKLNNVADVLSLRDTELLPTALGDDRPGDDVRTTVCALSGPSFALNNDIHTSTREAPDAQLLTCRLQEGTHVVRPMAFRGWAAATHSPNFRVGSQLAPPCAALSTLDKPRGHLEDASPPPLGLPHPGRSHVGLGLGPLLRHMLAEQDRDPPTGRSIRAPHSVVPSLG